MSPSYYAKCMRQERSNFIIATFYHGKTANMLRFVLLQRASQHHVTLHLMLSTWGKGEIITGLLSWLCFASQGQQHAIFHAFKPREELFTRPVLSREGNYIICDWVCVAFQCLHVQHIIYSFLFFIIILHPQKGEKNLANHFFFKG